MTFEKDSHLQHQTDLPRLLKLITWTRLISAIAILSSLAGSLLMLFIGAKNTLVAFLIFFGGFSEEPIHIKPDEEATLQLLESLDNFLVGLAFLYFAYGIYSLFINLNQDLPKAPQWLKVKNITVLKKSLLEVFIVLLSVIFVKRMLETIKIGNIEWQILVIPLSIIAIALSTRLMSFEGKSEE